DAGGLCTVRDEEEGTGIARLQPRSELELAVRHAVRVPLDEPVVRHVAIVPRDREQLAQVDQHACSAERLGACADSTPQSAPSAEARRPRPGTATEGTVVGARDSSSPRIALTRSDPCRKSSCRARRSCPAISTVPATY